MSTPNSRDIIQVHNDDKSNRIDDVIDKYCYLCLEEINFYYKFDCGCHNYFHTKCVENKIIEKCLICKKKINPKSNTIVTHDKIFDLYYSNLFLEKIKKILDIFFVIYALFPNFFTFGLYIVLNLGLIFGFGLPFMLINVICCIIKKYVFTFEFLDHSFLLLFIITTFILGINGVMNLNLI